MDLSHIGIGVRRQRTGYGFALRDVADMAGIRPERIAEIEGGEAPTTWEIAALGAALAVDPAALWRGDAGQNPRRSTARFRAPSGIAELCAHDARLLARAAEVGRILARLRTKLGEPGSKVVEARCVLAVDPTLMPWDHGYRLGRKARDVLSFKKEPISSMEGLLESLGVHVAHADFKTADIDAASVYEPDATPVIVLNRSSKRVTQPLSRRAVLAHELCHLLHDGGEHDLLTSISRVSEHAPFEQRANGFAPSFIVPGGWLELDVGEPRAFVLDVAKKWGLSFEGAAWHVKNAGRITEEQARTLLEHKDSVPPGNFESPLHRREPSALGLDVEPSNLAFGLLTEFTLRAYEAEIITAGRAMEIITIQ